jgi:hypothetical protein
VMIQPPAIDPENESKAETWRRLRGLPPKATFEAEPATTPKGVGASGERPFTIPKRSPAGGEGVDSRLTVMTDLDRYTRGDPRRMNDAHDAYKRSEDPLGSSYDWEKLRVKQKRAEEAKRAQERAAKRGLDEAGDESGPIDLTSEGDRFDFTGDRFDSPPSSPLHRARDDRPGNPSPGKGIRASAAPLDPRMRRKLGEDAQEDATHGTGECPDSTRPRRTARLPPPHPARLSWPPYRSNPREGLNEKPVKTRMTISSDGRRRPTRLVSAAELEKATAPSAITPTTKPRIASDNARTAARTTTPPRSACGRSRARYASRPVTPRTCAPR